MKSFLVLQAAFAALILQVHWQAFAKKSAHRLAQKEGELGQLEDGQALRGFQRGQTSDR
jgi:hypothetical protein